MIGASQFPSGARATASLR